MDKQDMMDFWLNSWRTYTTITAASLDAVLTMQKGMVSLSKITLSDGFDGADENFMREAFQRAADANVRRWSDTAGILQGLPSWVQKMHTLPSTSLTDMFDKAQRARV
ncbi:MAG: hypothetical protein FP825_13095 [Hyphomonas sp.]|uniref:hypothetical protein n=1 Tax=Hyphomonas sp. TaxID=87 RepID=UPI0018142170|nr:hypothetical protein [Hyphomonas sp.]MBA3069401.1 hypothetical protein [Hyphomonas sp.]MBU3921580.1 hypothetical protein [Alphaproteobacteria bacterium]MBU4063783.1 hypothetical protein [Alphaproteobacteria bacterium]MBU4164256.1 hypothetical protein [Alphaproteobacteria bacterium]